MKGGVFFHFELLSANKILELSYFIRCVAKVSTSVRVGGLAKEPTFMSC